jgi:hypothetical protein
LQHWYSINRNRMQVVDSNQRESEDEEHSLRWRIRVVAGPMGLETHAGFDDCGAQRRERGSSSGLWSWLAGRLYRKVVPIRSAGRK